MPEETLKQLKQFEAILKNCIVDRFKGNLPEEKKTLLMNTEFIKVENLVGLKNGNEIQGKVLRDMLSCIINIKSTKEFPLENGTNITLPIGEDIESEIIEFYAVNIADKYKFSINPGSPNLTLAFSLIESFGSSIDNMVLNNNIIQMFAQPSAANFAKTYTDNLLKPYSVAKVEVSSTEPIAIVDDPVQVTPISEEVDILSLAPTEKDVDESVVLETIDITPLEPEKEDVAETKDVPTTETQPKDQAVISEDKYKELCMKFARNEVLTPQEFNMLLMSTPQLMSEEDKNKLANASVELGEPNESQEVIFRGFAISSFPSYFVIFSIIFLIILGFIIL